MSRTLTITSLTLAVSGLAACAATPPGPGADAGHSAAAAIAAAGAPARPPPPIAAGPELADAARALDGALRQHLADRGAARDGALHGMDVAALLLYAARRADADLYDRLMPAAQKLIRQDPGDPYSDGFVLRRTREGTPPEESGAAETLWMARALWAGAGAFRRESDAALALTLLDAYARHAYTLQDVWLVRRAFDFRSRSFAGLSVLPAYHGDFLGRAQRLAPRRPWHGFAERSYVLVEHAATPSNLLLPVIQPEIGASWPGTGLEFYAPNNLSPLEDSCLAAEGVSAAVPNIATGVLGFAVTRARAGTLRAFYSVKDGSASGSQPLPGSGYACLVRLAMDLGDAEALGVLDPHLTAEMRSLTKAPARLPSAGPLLLAAQARGAF